MKHFLIMLLGCALPILLIFLLPALGVSSGVTLTVFMVIMLFCHLMHLMHFKLHSHETNASQDHEK